MSIFSEDDRTRIAKHVAEVEARTAGEVVPYVVMQSGAYPVVRWRGAGIAVLLGLVVAAALPAAGVTDLVAESRVLVPALLVLAAIGALIAGAVPPFVRTLAGAETLDRSAQHRAMQAFADEEVFATRDRTGILLFVSLLEHRIEVVADAGISSQVDPAAWNDVATAIRTGLASGSITEGFVDGLKRCQAILEDAGIERRADDTDELPNAIREESS